MQEIDRRIQPEYKSVRSIDYLKADSIKLQNGIPVYSTSADINVSGLGAGEEITIMIYHGNTVSSNNCLTLATDYQSSITINSNGNERLRSCITGQTV